MASDALRGNLGATSIDTKQNPDGSLTSTIVTPRGLSITAKHEHDQEAVQEAKITGDKS